VRGRKEARDREMEEGEKSKRERNEGRNSDRQGERRGRERQKE